ncbi:MAG TPA: MBL fold metallo-hydrolase [Minicystis sp.]|nr:MBL fold metallo-hydrolase [Minicystis sp.]
MSLGSAAWIAAAIATAGGAIAVALPGRHAARAPARAADDPPPKHAVHDLKIEILSTMLAEAGVGEWGFAAIVDVDGKRLLFDTGRFPDTVKRNARALKIDLEDVDEVVLSHHHGDHTGGLLALRDAVRDAAPKALARAHVGRGFFWPRRTARSDREQNGMIGARPAYEAEGGAWVEHDGPAEILPGVFVTGPVPRVHAEKNYDRGVRVEAPGGEREDDLPEDQALVFDTDRGLVVLAGCGHAGIVNTLEYARKIVRPAHVRAAIGGFHLYRASDATLAWTGRALSAMGVEDFLGAHCTGLEATFRMRELAGLSRDHCEVGAVGASWSTAKGIDPLSLAR